MIELKQLAKQIENKLNTQGNGGLEFKIFTDTGKYVKSRKKRNVITTVVNGLYSGVSSDITNTETGFTVATLTNKLEIVIPCKDNEEDVFQIITAPDGTQKKKFIEYGNDTFISNVRELIDNACAQTIFTTMTDKAGKTYDTSVAFSIAISGNRTQLPELGDCFTFVIYAYYNIVEGGENSRRWQVYLGKDRIPYSSLTLRRVPTQESNVFYGDLESKNTTTGHTLGVSLECPAIVGEFCNEIKKFILNGSDNGAHILTLICGDRSRSIPVVFGQVDSTASGILNVGLTISFAEAVELLGVVSFPLSYATYSVNTEAAYGDFTNNKDLPYIYIRRNINDVANTEKWEIHTGTFADVFRTYRITSIKKNDILICPDTLKHGANWLSEM